MNNENKPKHSFVSHLPDLIQPRDYTGSDQKKIRIQIRMTDKGIEILGDRMYHDVLEKLLAESGGKEIEGVLCG